jgi:hypothetical protein
MPQKKRTAVASRGSSKHPVEQHGRDRERGGREHGVTATDAAAAFNGLGGVV